jgi:hypothetical protein
MVAACIEGTGKFIHKMMLRRRDLLEILPKLTSENRETRLTAMLDILFIWARRQRGEACLLAILTGRNGFFIAFKHVFKRPSSEEKARQAHVGQEYLTLMNEMFIPQNAQYDLTQFILEKYPGQEAVTLTDLINVHLAPFHAWLKRLEKKRVQFHIDTLPG